MSRKGFTRNFRPLQVLTDEQIEAIHRGTLEVLEETGIRIEHQKALKILEDAGCRVDRSNMRVKIPPALVEECLSKCPSSFHLKARDPKNDLIIGGNTVYFSTFPGMQTVSLDTWEARSATRKENADALKILDALDNLHLITPYTPYFDVEGIPPVMALPESVAAKIRYTTKPQFVGYQHNSEIFAIRMAQALGIEIMGISLAAPPLTYNQDAIESMFRFTEAGFPVFIGSGAVMGGTAPATIAGSTITNNAELLAGIVLTQLIKPGTRVLVSEFVFPQDMRTGAPAFGAIGVSLHQVVFNQIWRKYQIPRHNSAAAPTSSKKPDFQCGYEKAIAVLTAALAGANVIQLHGGIHGELVFHPLQAILDDDIAGMVGRFIKGVEVTDETLAIDLIEETGPIPGCYLNKEHTRKWWKKEQFIPAVADRLTYPEWIKKGKKSTLDYAKERMEEILTTHQVPPLSREQDKQIDEILKEARRYYEEKKLL